MSELAAIEDRVNGLVRDNHEVTARVMPYDDAIAAGALAFFGDKYGDEVRMVSMGPSRELCGGTHVRATGDLGLFTFASEGSVASGVRRIEAFAGDSATRSVRELREQMDRVTELLKTSPESAAEKLADLQEELRRLKRRVEELEKTAAGSAAGDLAHSAREVSGHQVIAGLAPVENRDALRDLADLLRASGPKTLVVLAAEIEGKVALAAAASDDVVREGKVKAGELVGRVAKVAGGGGGGKAHLATAGAKDPEKLSQALDAVPDIVVELLG